MTKKFTFIDLFSGCGGFSKGFEQAGHECLLGVDFDKDAMSTFALNHNGAKTFHGDIHKLTKQKLSNLLGSRRVDIVIGGPPCQGFSTVGKGNATDPRNSLFMQFVRIVKLTKPKVVVLENVTGMLAKKNEKTLNAIFKLFEKEGYTLEARVLSSEEYGVPEKRRRTIIIGSKKCGLPLFPEITHGNRGKKKAVTVGHAFKNLKYRGKIYNHEIDKAQIKNDTDRKRLSYIPEGKGIRYQDDELSYLPKKLHYGVDWKNLREGRFRQTKLQRLDRKKPSYTILTSRTMYYHPTEDRYLTAREAAAIQSFPNNFKFSGGLTSQFRQIGNAVPVELGKQLGLTVKKMLLRKSKSKVKSKSMDEFRKRAFHYNSNVAA